MKFLHSRDLRKITFFIFRMIDRVLQNSLTVAFGAVSIYILLSSQIPDAIKISEIDSKSKISKYFLALIFGTKLAWSLAGSDAAEQTEISKG